MMKKDFMKKIAMFLALTISMYSCSQDSVVEEPEEKENKETPKDPEPEPEPEPLSWKTIPVPANAGDGKKWEFQEDISDDFEYEFAGENSLSEFGSVNGQIFIIILGKALDQLFGDMKMLRFRMVI